MTPSARETRRELAALHVQMVAFLSPQDRIRLYNRLKVAGRREALTTLRRLHQLATDFQTDVEPQRTEELESTDQEARALICWAAAAWSAKALHLFELLDERTQGLTREGLSAGEAGLQIAFEYEEDWAWMWPYPGLSPFADQPIYDSAGL